MTASRDSSTCVAEMNAAITVPADRLTLPKSATSRPTSLRLKHALAQVSVATGMPFSVIAPAVNFAVTVRSGLTVTVRLPAVAPLSALRDRVAYASEELTDRIVVLEPR